MRSFTQATPLRPSALLYILARTGVNAQLSSSVCSEVTVTFVPEPLTVTVYASNASSINTTSPPSVSISSLPISSSLDAIATLLPTSSLSLSISAQATALSTVLPTDIPSYDSLGLSTTSPSVDVSLSSVSSALTVPFMITTTLDRTSVSISDLVGGSTSLPTLSVSLQSNSLGLPSSELSATLSESTIFLASISLHSTSATIPASKTSSLSNVLSTSLTFPAVSLTFGLTVPTSSSVAPSLDSLTLSPTLPTLSPSGSLSDLSVFLATSTRSNTLPSSVTAVSSLPATLLSLSSGLSTLSLPSTSTIGIIPTPSLLTSVYCPADDGLQYLSPDDRPFELACNQRRLGNMISEDLASDLQSCTDECGNRPGCQSASYRPADGTCLLNSDTGLETPDNDWQSASTADLSCPGADDTQYMDHTGSFYQVLCDYSFPESYNITTAPGGDYLDCSSKCSELLVCSAFSYTDGVCTFTNGLGRASTGTPRNGTNTVILIAKRAVRVGPDNIPIVSAITITTNPRASTSALLGSVTTFLPGASDISSLAGTLLSLITTDTGLPSSPTILPSSLGLTSPGSIDVSITNILSTISSLPTFDIPSVDVSDLSSPLSSIPTITAPPLTSISLSSATLLTSQGPIQTAVSYTCPEVDGRIILENGLSYILNCSSIADGTPYASFPASSSFNDCFPRCDQSSTEGGAKYCTAFTFEGADNGAGPGTCYLFNDVGKNFLSANGRKAITAVRAVNYAVGVFGDGVSSILSSLLPGVTLPSTLSTTAIIPSLSASLPLIKDSATCPYGGNILNGCIEATATVGVGAGVGGSVVVGPSGSPILSAGVSATLGLSVSADVSLGLGLGVGSSGLSLGLEPTLGVDLGVTIGAGLGLGLGGGSRSASSNPIPAIASATTTPRTTTVLTTFTITSCLTGVGGVLTCPLGGLFTTLQSTSGAVTSISTSIKPQTSVSISISYITVIVSATSSSTAAPASTLSTMTISSSRSSSAPASLPTITASTSSTAPCAGTVNLLGICVL